MFYLHKVSDDFFYADGASDGSLYSDDSSNADIFIGNATSYLKSNGYDTFVIENKTES